MSDDPAPLAPIALFVFKRPAHTQRALESLARNPEFLASPLHVFCDGSRREDEDAAVLATRDVVNRFPHPNKTVHEAPVNRGLAASISAGVGQLCADHGLVIVVEDDLVVAPVFLDFMNRALRRYAADDRVMQISGHMFPVDLPSTADDAIFLPFTTSWGWATWQRAWTHYDPTMHTYQRLLDDRALRERFDLGNAYPYMSMLKKQNAGLIDSWAIRWYLSVFMREGLALYPRRTLVSNEGFDGSGMNCGVDGSNADATTASVVNALSRLPNVRVDATAFARVARFLRSENTFLQRASRRLQKYFV